MEETDAQIREKESMLLKVRETLQGYHHMRCAYGVSRMVSVAFLLWFWGPLPRSPPGCLAPEGALVVMR